MPAPAPADLPQDNALLLDIEGTTTAISFVYDVLFPYAAKAIPSFLETHQNERDVRIAIERILEDATVEERRMPLLSATLAVVRRQMAGDVKATGLKMLQGLSWKAGYESGEIKGHVYDDVPAALARWKNAQRAVAIYSSGSILAQRWLFRHSIAGDLSGFLVAHYDTTTGPKRDAASYLAIAQAWQRAPASITFCTDIPAEGEAAHQAGLAVVVMMRPGNAPLPAMLPFPVHADLSRL